MSAALFVYTLCFLSNSSKYSFGIGFIAVQSLTDIFGHNVDAASIGGWFDRNSDALILDQRLFWVFLLLFLAVQGAGRLSLDHWLNIDKTPE
jgi:putative oxidoreductase